MAPVINHAITVTIDGTERITSLIGDELSVRNTLANNASVADFVVEETKGYVPQPWDEVRIAVDGTTIFGGYLTQRNASSISGGSNSRVRWNLSARDWTALFDKLIVTAQYTGKSDYYIVQNLLQTYLPGEGITTTGVQSTAFNITIGFDRVTLREALNKLAKQVNAAWTISADKDFSWFNRWRPALAAFNINTAAPNNSTSFDAMLGSMRREIDENSAINRVTVLGANVQGDATFDTFLTQEGQTEYTLTYAPHSVSMVQVEIAADQDPLWFVQGGTPATSIGYEPDNIIADPDWDEHFPDIDPNRQRYVVVNREKQTVKIKPWQGDPNTGGRVIIWYYKSTPLAVVVNDTDLQALHGHIFEYQVYNPTIADPETAQAYGRTILDTYGYGKETISFDVTRFGLVPGRQILVYAPELDITSTVTSANWQNENYGGWLAENGNQIVLESKGENLISNILLESGFDWLTEDSGIIRTEQDRNTGSYIIQEVTYRAVTTPVGYLIIASVKCGETQQSIIDILSTLTGSGAAGSSPTANQRSQLSDVSSNLGEIVAGRAVFTNGGTAAFAWDNYNAHSGAIIGLDTNGTPAGAVYILDTGTVVAKLGAMDGLANIGTITPTGWGLWTQNGYFQGQIAASTISGGTVTGQAITGGTIDGALIYGGTIRTSGSPVNSSNPGVTMDASGLSGYGTAGLSFFLPTDPLLRPIFSSGTILNTVYEVTTASILRTGTVNPKIQMDNSGIFAYNSGGTLKFSVDAATGRLTASDGIFSGSISASTISGGTITGGSITASRLSSGTISGVAISANNISGGTISGVSISANNISGGTISGVAINSNTVTGGTITGGYVSGGTVSGARLTGGTTLIDSYLGFIGVGSAGAESARTRWNVSDSTYYFESQANVSIAGGQGGGSGHQMNFSVANASAIQHQVGGAGTISATINGNNVYSLTDGAIAFSHLITSNESIRPASSGLRNLGDSTHGWRYLYLSDGTDEWRIEINSGGVISATKM